MHCKLVGQSTVVSPALASRDDPELRQPQRSTPCRAAPIGQTAAQHRVVNSEVHTALPPPKDGMPSCPSPSTLMSPPNALPLRFP